jgi:hypothetical protein
MATTRHVEWTRIIDEAMRRMEQTNMEEKAP